MRLSDMRPGRDDAPLPAEVEAELDALDAALRGDRFPRAWKGWRRWWATSATTAPSPIPTSARPWTTGRPRVPRGRRPGLSERATKSDTGGRARLFAQSLTMRKLAYAGGAAATLVVLVVGVSQIDFQTSGDRRLRPKPAAPGRRCGSPSRQRRGGAGGARGARDRQLRARRGPRRGRGTSAPAAASSDAENSGSARGQEVRRIERDVQMTLAAPVDEVQDVTNEAIDVVEAQRGIVESSNSTATDERARGDAPARDPDAQARRHARPALRPGGRQVAERGRARHHAIVRRRPATSSAGCPRRAQAACSPRSRPPTRRRSSIR